jgi:hypothetical protein
MLLQTAGGKEIAQGPDLPEKSAGRSIVHAAGYFKKDALGVSDILQTPGSALGN